MSYKVYLMFITTMLMAFNYGIVIPVQPVFAENMGLTSSQYGLIIGIFALSQLIFSPYFGQSCDEKGRAKYIWVGLLIFALSDFIYFLAPTYEWLVFSRIIGGLAAAMVMPAVNGLVVDLTSEEQRSKAMLYVGASFSLGIIFGPVIGGFLGGIWYKLPFIVIAVIGLINAVVAFFLIKDVKTFPGNKVKPMQTLIELLSNVKRFWKTNLKYIFLAMLMVGMVLYGSETLISFYADYEFGATPQQISVMFVLIGIFEFFYQTVIGNPIINKIGELKFLAITTMLTGLGLFLIIFVPSYGFMLALIPLTAAGWVGMGACNSYLSKQESDNVATLISVNQFFISLGGAIGPIVIMTSFGIDYAAPFFLSFLLTIFAGLLIFKVNKSNKI